MVVRVVAMFGIALAVAISGTASLAAGVVPTSPPVAERDRLISDPACAGTPSIPIEFTEAFATRIPSSRVLRFISYLDRLPEADQKRVMAAIATATNVSLPSQAERWCRTVAGVSTVRALYLAAHRWSVPLGTKSDDGVKFTRAVEAAIVTLLDDRASESPRQVAASAATLAPFAYALSQSADPASAPSPCTLPDETARTIAVSNATYPQVARLSRTQGRVDVAVTVSDWGLVESVRLSRSTATDLPGGEGLAQSAIFAAAESTYAAERIACVTHAGTYLFRVDFTGK